MLLFPARQNITLMKKPTSSPLPGSKTLCVCFSYFRELVRTALQFDMRRLLKSVDDRLKSHFWKYVYNFEMERNYSIQLKVHDRSVNRFREYC
jgi:hypothetical protein